MHSMTSSFAVLHRLPSCVPSPLQARFIAAVRILYTKSIPVDDTWTCRTARSSMADVRLTRRHLNMWLPKPSPSSLCKGALCSFSPLTPRSEQNIAGDGHDICAKACTFTFLVAFGYAQVTCMFACGVNRRQLPTRQMPTLARGLPDSAGTMWWRVGPISLRSSSVSLVLSPPSSASQS